MRDHFIKVHVVSQRPGNPIVEGYVNVDSIKFFNTASNEAIKIGASTFLEDSTGTIYIAESIEEIHEAIIIATKDI